MVTWKNLVFLSPSTIEVVHEGPKLLLKMKDMVKLCHELLFKLKQETFVVDGVFFTELNDVLMRELAEVRVTPMRIEITIRATRYQNIFDEPGKQMRSDVRIKNTSSSHVASSPSGSDSDADDAESRG
ncbi:hypothetical protein RHGRI_026461 [Rhododendron griersonianum]|uniref:Uncharacterized protein n=1 Tax=Rhododendron griersonianum TaxID=479676 RepID=A0AAV6IST3_9ERIC|nr:hypothetical protein RHGRI_026461 [Rhododendron griersonianum]